jgi:enamine deaminase RidA (YjgF/YER057c/UK114 family)
MVGASLARVSHGSNSGAWPQLADDKGSFRPVAHRAIVPTVTAAALPARRKRTTKTMSAEINIYNPDELGPPMGQYTHVTRVKANEFLFIAGMLSGDSKGNVIGDGDFDAQTAQVFRNVEAALKSAGASWANVVQFTTYLVHSQDIPKFMAFRLREFPKMFPNGKYPPNTLLIVDRLVKEQFLVEVQTIAAV